MVKNSIQNIIKILIGEDPEIPVKVARIAYAFNYSIIKVSEGFENEVVDVINYETKKIFINDNAPYTVQRFQIAQKIGLILLSLTPRFDKIPKLELNRDASEFANCLLMPEDEFREFWKGSDHDMHLTANHFFVSKSSCYHRCKSLRLF